MTLKLFLEAICASTILGTLLVMAIQDMLNVAEYMAESVHRKKIKKSEDDVNVKIKWYGEEESEKGQD